VFFPKYDPGKDGADPATDEGNFCVAKKVVEIVSEGMCVACCGRSGHVVEVRVVSTSGNSKIRNSETGCCRDRGCSVEIWEFAAGRSPNFGGST